MNKIIDKIRTIKLNRLDKNKKFNLVVSLNDDYILFEDNWISESDNILYDIYGNGYNVLGFKELEINIVSGFRLIKQKVSAIKIDKKVKIGELFSTY